MDRYLLKLLECLTRDNFIAETQIYIKYIKTPYSKTIQAYKVTIQKLWHTMWLVTYTYDYTKMTKQWLYILNDILSVKDYATILKHHIQRLL